MKPRISAKARRRALARRIARHLFTGGTGSHASRLVLVEEVSATVLFPKEEAGPAKAERELGGWCERAVVDLLEAELRPGQRRRRPRG